MTKSSSSPCRRLAAIVQQQAEEIAHLRHTLGALHHQQAAELAQAEGRGALRAIEEIRRARTREQGTCR